MAWTVDQFKGAFALTPEVTNKDVALALQGAGRTLSRQKQKQLRDNLHAALGNYIQDRIFEIATREIMPSRCARRLDQISAKASALLKAVGTDADPIGAAVMAELRRQSVLRESDLRETLNLGPLFFLEKAALSKTIRAVEMLRDLANSAKECQQRLVQKNSGSNARHKGDAAMHVLFQTINDIWLETFREVPGVTWDEGRATYGGAYIPFVRAVLHSFAAKVPSELEKLDRGVAKRLRLSDRAIHSHFRRTNASKVKRIAESVLK